MGKESSYKIIGLKDPLYISSEEREELQTLSPLTLSLICIKEDLDKKPKETDGINPIDVIVNVAEGRVFFNFEIPGGETTIVRTDSVTGIITRDGFKIGDEIVGEDDIYQTCKKLLQKFQQRDKNVGEKKSDFDTALTKFAINPKDIFGGFMITCLFEKNPNIFLVYKTKKYFRDMEVADENRATDAEIMRDRLWYRESLYYVIPLGQEKEFIDKSRMALGEGYTPDDKNVESLNSTLTELAEKIGVN